MVVNIIMVIGLYVIKIITHFKIKNLIDHIVNVNYQQILISIIKKDIGGVVGKIYMKDYKIILLMSCV